MASSDEKLILQKKVCMLGGFGVGKTSLVRRYVESIFDDGYQTTVGVRIDKRVVELDDRRIAIVLWDFAGKDRFSDIRSSHLRGAAGFVVVIDPTRAKTLTTAVEVSGQAREDLGGVPFVVVLNKADLAEAWAFDISAAGEAFPENVTIVKTSAKTGMGVEEMFLDLAKKLL
jgi:hypothetical protein